MHDVSSSDAFFLSRCIIGPSHEASGCHVRTITYHSYNHTIHCKYFTRQRRLWLAFKCRTPGWHHDCKSKSLPRKRFEPLPGKHPPLVLSWLRRLHESHLLFGGAMLSFFAEHIWLRGMVFTLLVVTVVLWQPASFGCVYVSLVRRACLTRRRPVGHHRMHSRRAFDASPGVRIELALMGATVVHSRVR
jgi:hypothetical protein